MALDVKLSYSKTCLRAILRGTVGLAEGREVVRKVVTVTEQTGALSPILLDIRDTTCALSDADIEALVDELSAHQAALSRKMAIVYCDDRQGDVARSFELSAWIHELRIRVFTDDAGAVQWLDGTPETEAS